MVTLKRFWQRAFLSLLSLSRNTIGRLLILLFSFFIIAYMMFLITPIITGANLNYTPIGNYPFQSSTLSNLPGVIIHLDGFQPGRTGGKFDVLAENIEVYLPPFVQTDREEPVCIDYLNVETNVEDVSNPYNSDARYGSARGRRGPGTVIVASFQDFCQTSQTERIRVDFGHDKRLAYGDSPTGVAVGSVSTFYYPFDKRTLDAKVWFTGHLSGTVPATEVDVFGDEPNSDALTITPDINGAVSLPDWDEDVSISHDYDDMLQNDVLRLRITFNRPLLTRVVFVILLASLFLFSVALAFVNDVGSFLQTAVAILLGLWGVQGLLVPTEINEPTMVEPIIMVLYITLTFSVFVRFLIKPLWQKLGEK